MTTTLERLTVPCRCKAGWILPHGAKSDDDWVRCRECLGYGTRSETDEEMAARLAGDLDEWERLQRPEG